jgi:hypothetical protein
MESALSLEDRHPNPGSSRLHVPAPPVIGEDAADLVI